MNLLELLNFGPIVTNSNWEAFTESLNKYIDNIDSTTAQLSTQSPQLETLLAADAQLSATLESSHQNILKSIFDTSELEFEAMNEVEAVPTLEQVQAMTIETKEAMKAIDAEYKEKKARLSATNGELESIKEQVEKEAQLLEENKAKLKTMKKVTNDQTARICFKMHGNNPIALLINKTGQLEDVVLGGTNNKENTNKQQQQQQGGPADKEIFWASLNEQFSVQ